jgi:DNA-binding CsgD family transcriptional regulator
VRDIVDGRGQLLERAVDLALARELLGLVGEQRQGALLLVEAPAGMGGKTTFMRELRAMARGLGVRPVVATGAELEDAFAFGVALELFAPLVRELDEPEREELLSGPAALVAPLFGAGGSVARPNVDAVVHGLFWLSAGLADREPLALLVDDAHWADGPSMRALAYLSRRVEDLPIMLVVAFRPEHGGPAHPFIERLCTEPAAKVVSLAPLSREAAATLVRTHIHDAHERFCAACHDTTAGNPFYLSELLLAVAEQGIAGTAEGAARLGDLGPRAVARSIMQRLSALDAQAGALARAVALLGPNAPLQRAAAIAGMTPEAALARLDELAASQILDPRTPPRFVHPIVRTVVLAAMTPAQRSVAHRRAAERLVEEQAPAMEAGAHLLEVEPAADPAVVEALWRAADEALARGAAEEAARFLERAAREPPAGEQRDRIELELGRVEVRLLRREGPDRLQRALAGVQDTETRVALSVELALALGFARRVPQALALLDDMRSAHAGDPGVFAALDVATAQVARLDLATRPALVASLGRLRALDDRGELPPSARIELAREAVNAGEPLQTIVPGLRGSLAELEGTSFEQQAESHCNGVIALMYCDELDVAIECSRAIVADAERRGDVHAVAQFVQLIGMCHHRAGDLPAAEVELRRSLDILEGWEFIAPQSRGLLACVLLDRGDIEGARALCERPGEGPARIFLIYARALLDAADTAHGDALRGFLSVGEARLQTGHVNTTPLHWRAHAARALLAVGRPADAERLACEELALARRFGSPRSIGIALLACGLIADRDDAPQRLAEAVAALASSSARVDHARALTHLGGALRRAGRRGEARAPLREALDLAARCGAHAVVEHAREELRASGARPRRTALSGVAALTPSERRVAELAADGLTNRKIAQALYVTPKTVEGHLSRSYDKLGIDRKSDLPAALGAR